MWIYEKRLQYPVCINKKDVTMARYLITQYGGPDGELAASLRYMTQRYTIEDRSAIALLTDIATEELAHLEMIATMVYKLLEDATPKELESAGLGTYFVDHGRDLVYTNGDGIPFTSAYLASKGDPIANLYEDIAAEEKARAVYEKLILMTDDTALQDTLRFLREREIIHSQRFREVLERLKDNTTR